MRPVGENAGHLGGRLSFQVSLDFTVNRMLNQNSLYASAIHDSPQLGLHILSPMNLEELMDSSAFLVFIKIATVG